MAKTSCSTLKARDYLKSALKCFKLLGLNPVEIVGQAKTRRERVVNFLKQFVFYAFVINYLLFIILILAYAISHRNDFQQAFVQAMAIVFAPSVLCKMFAMWNNCNKFKQIMKTLDDHPAKTHESEAKKIHGKFKKISSSFIYFFVSLAVLRSIAPFLNYLASNELHLPLHMWFPFDQNDLGIFTLVYLWMALSTVACALFLSGCDVMLYGFLTIISLKFEFLAKEFQDIDVRKIGLKINLIELIKQHGEFITAANKLQAIFSLGLFSNFFGASILICCSCFQLTSFHEESTVLICYGFGTAFGMLQILLLCYFSQKLIDSSLSIGDGVYKLEWYSIEDVQIRKLILLVIMRSQKQNHLTATFAVISLESYTFVSYKLLFLCRLWMHIINNFFHRSLTPLTTIILF